MGPRKLSQQQSLPGNRGQQNNRRILLLPTTPLAQSGNNGAPSPPLSWYASISAISLSPAPSVQSASGDNSPTITLSSTALYESTPQVVSNSAIPTGSSLPTAPSPLLPSTRHSQPIPISFLVNPTPQSPSPFPFPDVSSPCPSPPPVSGVSLASSSTHGEHPNRQYSADHSLAIASATTTLNDPSPSNDISRSPQPSTVNALDISSVNTNERTFTVSFNRSSQIHPLLTSTSSTAAHGVSVISDQRPGPSTTRSFRIGAQDTTNTETPPMRQVSLRRTMNPDVKTTKTGKIQHRPKRIGANRKNTAYNRFLSQRSRSYAKRFPDLTPQQRMKRISEEWAVSEKNPHTTRRRNRFSAIEDQQELSSSSSALPLQIQSENSMSADEIMGSQQRGLFPDVEIAVNARPLGNSPSPCEFRGTHSTPPSPYTHQYQETYCAGSSNRFRRQIQLELALSNVTSSGSTFFPYVEERRYEGEEGGEDHEEYDEE